ncbi:hypothetical protein [Agarilytica rhodophyticola]|uniref:hypothetical protein n=1 Tax=Agarilytica rhodophyticola TaxID=1737490 RepID=UPI000CD96A17|nr:hypothetical protein [Agarilytica rhodophyticola]
MSKYSTLSKELTTQLVDQFKIEYNKITGKFAQGNLSVIEAEDYFYFRASNDSERMSIEGGALSGSMSGDDADFLASMLSFVAITWDSEDLQLQPLYSAMNKEVRSSRPDIEAFFKS